MGRNPDKIAGGYITYFNLGGRPKDYTATKYGVLSATLEGCGRINGDSSGYSVDT